MVEVPAASDEILQTWAIQSLWVRALLSTVVCVDCPNLTTPSASTHTHHV